MKLKEYLKKHAEEICIFGCGIFVGYAVSKRVCTYLQDVNTIEIHVIHDGGSWHNENLHLHS